MPKPRVLNDDEDFPIKPWDIEAVMYMDGAFSDVNTCVSAGKLVCLARLKGNWRPLGLDDILLFHQLTVSQPVSGDNGCWEKRWSFNELSGEVGRNLIVEGADGKYRFTDDFIYYCYHAHPLIRASVKVDV